MADDTSRRALVLGGSIAGLLAARALAERHLEVHILDRDDLCNTAGHRRGVPQANHIHVLLPRGREVLEELFPGITAELLSAGAASGDLLGDSRAHLSGHRLARAHSGLLSVSCSRPLLEDRLRARVRALPNVTFASPCDVLGVTATRHGDRVTGVRVLRRADGSAEEQVTGDLVVDALGRGSAVPRWLEALGRGPVVEDRVQVDLGCATRTYRIGHRDLDGDWGVLVGPTGADPRGGSLARIEGDRWIVTLFGLLGQHPPTDDAGFLRFARSLPSPDIPTVIGGAEPIDAARSFRFPASVRRRYERLANLPDGLVSIGDAACSLDPIYGQGMTVAAASALVLRAHLDDLGRLHTTRSLVGALAEVVDPAWQLASGADLAVPGVQGRRTAATRIAGRYIVRLHEAAAVEPDLATAFIRVMALVDPPSAVLRPAVVRRVLRHRLRRRATARGEPGRRDHSDRQATAVRTRRTGREVEP